MYNELELGLIAVEAVRQSGREADEGAEERGVRETTTGRTQRRALPHPRHPESQLRILRADPSIFVAQILVAPTAYAGSG